MKHVSACGFVAGCLGVTVGALAAPQIQDSYLIGSDPTAFEYNASRLWYQVPDDGPGGYVDGAQWGANTSNFLVSADSLAMDAVGYGGPAGGKVAAIGVPDSDMTRYARRLVEPFTAGTMYMSGIVNRGDGMGNTGPAEVIPGSFIVTGFMNSASENLKLEGQDAGGGNMFGLTWGFGGNSSGGYDLIVRHRHREIGDEDGDGKADEIDPFNDVLLANADANTNYLVIFKFEFNTNPSLSVPGGNDLLTYWVGTAASGFDVTSETTATATALATGQLGSYGLNTDGDIGAAVFAQRYYEAGAAYFDENRLGFTFADVTVPEPASLALFSLAGAMALRRRSRFTN